MPQARAETTRCDFGGSAPGFRVVQLDLTSASSFLNIEISGTRPTRGLNTGPGWHLAQGVVVLRSEDRTIVAHRLRSTGSSPPGAVVRVEGTDAGPLPDVPAPDVAFTHTAALAPDGLEAGTYSVVAWAAGGSGLGGPPDGWAAAVELEGAHSCAGTGTGAVFDLDQNDFVGGTQVSAPGFALMRDASLRRDWSGSLIVGMIDAAVQGAGTGEAVVDYLTPSGTGSVNRALEPFLGSGGPYRFDAEVSGLFPVVSITGVSIDL